VIDLIKLGDVGINYLAQKYKLTPKKIHTVVDFLTNKLNKFHKRMTNLIIDDLENLFEISEHGMTYVDPSKEFVTELKEYNPDNQKFFFKNFLREIKDNPKLKIIPPEECQDGHEFVDTEDTKDMQECWDEYFSNGGSAVYSTLPPFKIPKNLWKLYFTNYNLIDIGNTEDIDGEHLGYCSFDGVEIVEFQYWMPLCEATWSIYVNVCPSSEDFGKLGYFMLMDSETTGNGIIGNLIDLDDILKNYCCTKEQENMIKCIMKFDWN